LCILQKFREDWMERDRIKTPQRLLFFSADTTSPILNSTGAQYNFVFLAFLTYPVNNYGLFFAIFP